MFFMVVIIYKDKNEGPTNILRESRSSVVPIQTAEVCYLTISFFLLLFIKKIVYEFERENRKA